ncbi:hypothetical protein [Mesorhizobium sp. M0013]|uniref:hypothetical protein n=1 Tax=Mesorhizobium sp. M0013 TaxID=2956841 RepID=UPI0033390212
MKTLPAFTITSMSEYPEADRILAEWTSGESRFFVWLSTAEPRSRRTQTFTRIA